MKKLVVDVDQDGRKASRRFFKVVIKKRSSVQAVVYNFGFSFCKLLNLVAVLIS